MMDDYFNKIKEVLDTISDHEFELLLSKSGIGKCQPSDESICDGCGLIDNSLILKDGFEGFEQGEYVLDKISMQDMNLLPIDVTSFCTNNIPVNYIEKKIVRLIHDDIDINLHEKLREKFLERINDTNSCSSQVADDNLTKYGFGYNPIRMPYMWKEAIKQFEEDEVKRQLNKLNIDNNHPTTTMRDLDKTLKKINNLKKDVKEIERSKSKQHKKNRFYE